MFVNSVCNLKCKHCFFIHAENEPVNDLRLDEITRISRSFKIPFQSMVLTGGEPFLRKDLYEICEAFVKNPGVGHITIASNGFYTDRMAKFVKAFLDTFPTSLTIQLSIDGMRETHNTIRKNEDSFDRVIQTFNMLKEFEGNERFHCTGLMTVHSHNIAEIEDVYAFSKEVGFVLGFELMRGSSFFSNGEDYWDKADPDSLDLKQLTPTQLAHFHEVSSRIYRSNSKWLAGDSKLWRAICTAYRISKLDYVVDVSMKKRFLGCSAGQKSAVIYSDGRVAMCELTKPVGSLRENGYDFEALWSDATATKMKKAIQRCPGCTHGCFIYDPLKYDAKTYGRMAKHGIQSIFNSAS